MASEEDIAAMKQRVQEHRDGILGLGPKEREYFGQIAAEMGFDMDTLLNSGGGRAFGGGMVSGGTFNFDDEIAGAAAAIMPGGKTYEEARDARRSVNRSNELMNPGARLTGEIGSGLAASFVPIAGQVGRGAGFGKAMLTGAGAGAAEGAASSVGSQEGPKGWDGRVGLDAAVGGTFGAVGGFGGKMLADWMGPNADRAQRAAAEEMQRIMRETGLSPDDIVRRMEVGGGSALTKNKTLKNEVRVYFDNASPETRTQVLEEASALAEQSRKQVLPSMRSSLPEDLPSSRKEILDYLDVPDRAGRYNQAYAEGNQPGRTTRLSPLLEEAVGATEGMGPRLDRTAKAGRGIARREGVDFPTVVQPLLDGGRVQRDMTGQEADMFQRALRSAQTDAYKGDIVVPDEGRYLGAINRDARGVIKEDLPLLDQLIGEVAKSKAAQEAYEQSADMGFSKEKAMALVEQWDEFTPEQQLGVRAGLLRTVEKHLRGKGPNAQPLTKLQAADELSEPLGELFARAFPGQERDLALGVGRQDAVNALTGGSQTASLQARAARRGGSDMSIADAAVSGSVGGAAVQAARKFIQKVGGLNGIPSKMIDDRMVVALTTENPAAFRAAMQGDPEAIAWLSRSMMGRIGAQTAAPTGSGVVAGSVGTDLALPMLLDE